jgi:hypothetical protein
MKINKCGFLNHSVLIIFFVLIFTDNAVSQVGKPNGTSAQPVLPDTNSLKEALNSFMDKVDNGKYLEVIPYYDSGFLSIRVVDAGQFIKMDYTQMVYFWNMQSSKRPPSNTFSQRAIITQKTIVHNIEILGNNGYVLMTRLKDLGNGTEPMFYSLIWIIKNNKWYLLREIVHQRTLPALH